MHNFKMCNNVYDIIKAVNRLKAGKSDGEEGLYTEDIINAPHILFVFLAQVYNAMNVHGMCPESMIIGTMIPISKVKRQFVCNSDNFRAIALSSKAFDRVS